MSEQQPPSFEIEALNELERKLARVAQRDAERGHGERLRRPAIAIAGAAVVLPGSYALADLPSDHDQGRAPVALARAVGVPLQVATAPTQADCLGPVRPVLPRQLKRALGAVETAARPPRAGGPPASTDLPRRMRGTDAALRRALKRLTVTLEEELHQSTPGCRSHADAEQGGGVGRPAIPALIEAVPSAPPLATAVTRVEATPSTRPQTPPTAPHSEAPPAQAPPAQPPR